MLAVLEPKDCKKPTDAIKRADLLDLNTRFYPEDLSLDQTRMSSGSQHNRIKKRFILDASDISKRSQIQSDLTSTPTKVFGVTDISEGFEKLTNS